MFIVNTVTEEKNTDIRNKYLNNPCICPYCNSPKISADRFDDLGECAVRAVCCLACNKEWKERFTLTDIFE